MARSLADLGRSLSLRDRHHDQSETTRSIILPFRAVGRIPKVQSFQSGQAFSWPRGLRSSPYLAEQETGGSACGRGWQCVQQKAETGPRAGRLRDQQLHVGAQRSQLPQGSIAITRGVGQKVPRAEERSGPGGLSHRCDKCAARRNGAFVQQVPQRNRLQTDWCSQQVAVEVRKRVKLLSRMHAHIQAQFHYTRI